MKKLLVELLVFASFSSFANNEISRIRWYKGLPSQSIECVLIKEKTTDKIERKLYTEICEKVLKPYYVWNRAGRTGSTMGCFKYLSKAIDLTPGHVAGEPIFKDVDSSYCSRSGKELFFKRDTNNKCKIYAGKTLKEARPLLFKGSSVIDSLCD